VVHEYGDRSSRAVVVLVALLFFLFVLFGEVFGC
jgi:hypothetical protein